MDNQTKKSPTDELARKIYPKLINPIFQAICLLVARFIARWAGVGIKKDGTGEERLEYIIAAYDLQRREAIEQHVETIVQTRMNEFCDLITGISILPTVEDVVDPDRASGRTSPGRSSTKRTNETHN